MSKATLFDCSVKKYAYQEPAQIYKELGISPQGLTQEQAAHMGQAFGENVFAAPREDTMLRRLRRAFLNPFSSILCLRIRAETSPLPSLSFP